MQDRSRLKLDAPAGGAQARLDREKLRLVRTLGFAEGLATALRQEFAASWADGRGHALRGEVAAVEDLAARGRAFLAEQERAGPIEALAALQAHDLSPLLAATQDMQLRAEAVRRDLSGPAAAPAGPPARNTGPLGPLRRSDPLPGATGGRGGRVPGPLPRRDPVLTPERFEATCRQAGEVLAYVAGRLALVEVALGATGLPGPRAPWHHVGPALERAADVAGIEEALRPWLPLLARLFYADPAATREALTALELGRQAQALAREAEALRARLPALPPEARGQLIAQLDAGRLRAALHPLGHLHVRFGPFPHLRAIFPGPPLPRK